MHMDLSLFRGHCQTGGCLLCVYCVRHQQTLIDNLGRTFAEEKGVYRLLVPPFPPPISSLISPPLISLAPGGQR